MQPYLADVAAPYLASCYGRLFKGGERLVDAQGAVAALRQALLAKMAD